MLWGWIGQARSVAPHGAAPTRARNTPLQTQAQSWKVYALLNHDLRQVFIGASDRPMSEMRCECDTAAREIPDWLSAQHNIEKLEAVETFPNLRSAKAYAGWLHRDGAFEGAEDYVMGLDAALA